MQQSATATKNPNRHCLLLLTALLFLKASLALAQSPVPTPPQLVWHDTEFYLFCHFGPNTFTNVEWGHGTEPKDVFNPTDLEKSPL